MKLLFTLLLGAAVQCPNKQLFIARIKELDVDTQHAIVDVIKSVTDSQTLVLNNDALENLSVDHLRDHVVRIARERDKYHTKWFTYVTPALGSDAIESKFSQHEASSGGSATPINSDQNHLAVELADLKSKMRKLRQEL